MHGLGTNCQNGSCGVLRVSHPRLLYCDTVCGQAAEVQPTAYTMLLLQQDNGATYLLFLCATTKLYVLLDDVLPMFSVLSGAWVSVRQMLWLVWMHLLHAVLSEQPCWHPLFTGIQWALRLFDICLHTVSTAEAVGHRRHNLGRYFDSSVCYLLCSLPRIVGTVLRWLHWLYVRAQPFGGR